MLCGVNVWQIAKLKVIGEIKFGKWIDFAHKNTIYKLKFGCSKFGKSWTTRQIHQTFLLSNIPTKYMCICGLHAINICMCKAVSTQHLGSRSMPSEEFLKF